MRVILYNGKYYASVSFSQGNRWCRGCCLRSSCDCTGIWCDVEGDSTLSAVLPYCL